MARLDGAITNIVDVFMDYADDGGKKRQLNKEELKKLFEQEIECPELKDKISAGDIEEAMEMLDKNHDAMARMEQAIKDIVDMFLEYANGDGKLNKDELTKMIDKEIKNPELKVSYPCSSTYINVYCKFVDWIHIFSPGKDLCSRL
uniref:S100/CaBP-9k-type calcium binding subdomain domain-containing protein n=1 Tax=Oryzias sinensis TaxID=183150 RepID=A0A8C7Y8F2_9TELE